jgi:citrate synthase
MNSLQEHLGDLIPKWRDDARAVVKEHGDTVISQVTVAQAFGGMRGVKGMICETSMVDPEKGLIIRGTPIGELTDFLPEDIFYLLCTGEHPSPEALKSLQDDLNKRAEVPAWLWDMLRAMPKSSHPMAMLDTAILALEEQSVFRKRYAEGMAKTDYWEAALEDSLTLIAQITSVAAGVYRILFKDGELIPHDPSLDWAANYANMLGLKDPHGTLQDLMRLYLVLHCDHEGGNVSANTCHTVGSALSDPYYSVAAGLNGLAGPLHGLANQECLGFILGIHEKYKGVPTDQEMVDYAWDVLNGGKVVPGYGHAVLRATDPRFTAFLKFGKERIPDDEVFQIVEKGFRLLPEVLKEHGKAKNPWPNVDAGSGALLYHYGMTEFSYYTVLFSVSRVLGMLSQLVLNRAMGTPITRPKSHTVDWIKNFVSNQ